MKNTYQPGERVRFHTHPQGCQLCSTGIHDLYLHLNAHPYITGTVIERMPGQLDSYILLPDGWPLPEGMGSLRGFVANCKNLEPWPQGPPTVPPWVNGACQPLDPAEAQKIVEAYLEKEGAPYAAATL